MTTRRIVAGVTALLALALPLSAAAAPLRVASLNVCTDQLVLALAVPGQIAALSRFAGDPRLSASAGKATGFATTRGTAEEVFTLKPDLVVTGSFSLHNTTELLRQLGFTVEEFGFDSNIAAVPTAIRRMGKLLGREDEAEAQATAFEDAVQRLAAPPCAAPPLAIIYEQNGVTLGAGTLADSALRLAGFRNLAAEQGIEGMGPLPLEVLVKAQPDLVIFSGYREDAPALADQTTRHPAFASLHAEIRRDVLPPAALSCGSASALAALATLRHLHDTLSRCGAAP